MAVRENLGCSAEYQDNFGKERGIDYCNWMDIEIAGKDPSDSKRKEHQRAQSSPCMGRCTWLKAKGPVRVVQYM
jgi:hypothetical protein